MEIIRNINNYDQLNESDVSELLKFFPFQEILDANPMNVDLTRSLILFLKKLSEYSIFYENQSAIQYTLDFLGANLMLMKEFQVCEIFSELLILLKIVINKTKETSNKYIKQFLISKENYFLALADHIIELQMFTIEHALDYSYYLLDILMLNETVNASTLLFLEKVYEKLSGLGAFRSLVMFSVFIFPRFSLSDNVMIKFMIWALIEGPSNALKFQDDKEFVQTLLMQMHLLWTKYLRLSIHDLGEKKVFIDDTLERFSSNLKVFHNDLLLLSSHTFFHVEVLNVLGIMYSICFEKDYDEVQQALFNLPNDLNEWPATNSDLFFKICCLQFEINKKSVWPNHELVVTIPSLIYSSNRFAIKNETLRLICVIMPFLMEDSCKAALILSNSVLRIVESKPTLNEILLCTDYQLSWIMNQGSNTLKKDTVVFWLENGDIDVIVTVLKPLCNDGVLFSLLIDSDLDENISEKLIYVVNKLESHELAQKIATKVHMFFKCPNIFERLMLAGPGLLNDEDNCVFLCHFMSMAVILMNTERCLKSVCVFFTSLLRHLRHRNDILNFAIADVRVLQILYKYLRIFGDDTAVEILELLITVLKIQKRQNIEYPQAIKIDLSSSLNGSELKIRKCLELLRLLATSQKTILEIKESSLIDVLEALFVLYPREEYQETVLVCLIQLFKHYNELVTSPVTFVFIENNCWIDVKSTWSLYISFLYSWLKILMRLKPASPRLPGEVLLTYIDRLPSLPQHMESKLRRMIAKLSQVPPKSVELFGNLSD